MKLQTLVTFFLIGQSKNRKYESGAKFHELFENHHHLSDLLNSNRLQIGYIKMAFKTMPNYNMKYLISKG